MNANVRTSRRPVAALAAAALILGLAAGAAAQAKAARPRLLVPNLDRAPAIDGTMSGGEWDRAATVSGFIGATGSYGKVMVPKAARIYLAHRDRTFYVAVWMQLAPGEKPTMRYRKRDDKVYMDRQQFELWLTPPTDAHVTAYQLIGNAYGAMYDIKFVPAFGVKQPGWNPKWQFKNAYKTGEYWTAEFAIPFDELIDKDGYNPDKPWGGMVAVAWPQRSWPYTFGWYKNIETHAQMVMGATQTCAQLMSMDSLFDNTLAPKLRIVNGEAEEAAFVIHAEAGDVTHRETIRIPAGEVRAVSFSKNRPATKEKVNVVKMTVTGPGEKVLLDGQWMCRPIPGGERTLKPVEPKPWQLDTRVAYAPLAMGCHCWADVLDAPMRDRIRTARFRVRGADGEVIRQAEDREFTYDSAEAYLWLPKDLSHGEYTVVTEFLDAEGKVLASATDQFKHKDYKKEFVWLDSDKYGERLVAFRPFSSLRTRGRGFEVWGRSYGMRGALPQRIVSQGVQMLARPVTLAAEVGGKTVRARIAERFEVTSRPNRSSAEFTGRYTVAGLDVGLTGRILFDGAITYDLKAEPIKGAKHPPVDRLYLSIPVREELGLYLWSTRGGGGSVHKFLENLPDSGVIWDSDSVADFVPYLGIADDERALQWFADNDHEWVLGHDAPCAQVVRARGAVEMQVNLIRRKGPVRPLRATFGLIATPIKPMPKGWRDTILHFGNLTGSDLAFFYGPGHGKVGPFDWHDSAALAKANGIDVPKGKTAAEVLDAMSGKGYPDLKAIEAGLGKDVAEGHVAKGLRTYEDPKAVKICYFHNAQMYFEGTRSKAFRTFFRGDWTIVPPGGWFHLRPVESYQDFFCFHLTQFLKFWSVPGLYFDEVYFGRDFNVFNGQGKVMPDGTVRPSVGLMLQRRFLHRCRQCCLDEGVPPFLWVHTSNIMAPYAIAAVDVAMFGEDNTPTPQQDIIDNIRPQYIRILGMSQKFGFVPVWMTMAGRGGSGWSLAGRQTFGWCWMHDTVPEVHTHHRGRPLVHYRNQWGIAADDVDFQGYWQKARFTKTDDGKFLVSSWTRPRPAGGKKALLMVMNLHYRPEKATDVTVTVDPEALGLTGDWKAYNLESMPAYRKREQVMRKLDAEAGYGARQLGKDQMDRLLEGISQDLFRWQREAVKPYELDKLEVLSDGKPTFKLQIPGRDFLTVIIE
jgi:hypothetical protein